MTILGTPDSAGASIAYLRLLAAGHIMFGDNRDMGFAVRNRLTGGHTVTWYSHILDHVAEFFYSLTQEAKDLYPHQPLPIIQAVQGYALNIEVGVSTEGRRNPPRLAVRVVCPLDVPNLSYPFHHYPDERNIMVRDYIKCVEDLEGPKNYLSHHNLSSVISRHLRPRDFRLIQERLSIHTNDAAGTCL